MVTQSFVYISCTTHKALCVSTIAMPFHLVSRHKAMCLSSAQYRVDIGALCLFTACLQGCMRIEERLGSMRIEARLHARGPACHGMQHGVLHSGVQHAVLSRSNRARCLLSAVVTHVNMLVCVRCNACQGTACPAGVRGTACQVCVHGNACQEP